MNEDESQRKRRRRRGRRGGQGRTDGDTSPNPQQGAQSGPPRPPSPSNPAADDGAAGQNNAPSGDGQTRARIDNRRATRDRQGGGPPSPSQRDGGRIRRAPGGGGGGGDDRGPRQQRDQRPAGGGGGDRQRGGRPQRNEDRQRPPRPSGGGGSDDRSRSPRTTRAPISEEIAHQVALRAMEMSAPADERSVELGAAFKEAQVAVRDARKALAKRKAEAGDEPDWLLEQEAAAIRAFEEAATAWSEHLETTGRKRVPAQRR